MSVRVLGPTTTRQRHARQAPTIHDVLTVAAADLRRGVDPHLVARRLDQHAAAIDPTITGRLP